MNKNNRIRVGIQMFNLIKGGDWEQVREEKDAEKLLAELAAAGIDGIEWCNFQFNIVDLDLPALKSTMDQLGLETCSIHFHKFGDTDLETESKKAVERCRIFQTDRLIFAFSLPTMFGIEPDEKGNYTPEQIDAWAAETDRILDLLRKAAEGTGIKILYHNHNTEMLKGSDGRYFLDMIHPDGLETDVYWIAKGLDGKVSSALEFIRSRREQVALFHMKDGLDGSLHTGEMCGWGKGTYPLQTIADTAKELGLTWVVMENDEPKNFGTTGLEDARESAAYAAEHIDLS